MQSSEALRPAGGRKPLGKLAARLEEVKNPWREGSRLELSHNEAARLATDALLELGEPEYRHVLAEERELGFLSPLEISYISRHAHSRSPEPDGGPERDDGDADALSELTSGTYFPMMSDYEPPMLELGWPEGPGRFGPSDTQIYFQRDKNHNIKDLIRSLANKAKKVIAVVMDIFTDVDLMCDLMEASSKRRVPVYILLDEKNLSHFLDMCDVLDIQSAHLNNMRIRSICGDTYCTRGGKKFTGQVLQKFMIIDCEEVIAGSYSFTWLSAQVHNNMVMHFSGFITESFDREFRCLYADSQIIDRFNPEEEEMPYYSSYQPILAPGIGMGLLDIHTDRQRERSCSENSSSKSSNSMSSIKLAPGMTSNNIYKVTQSHDKESAISSLPSPERRGGLQRMVGQSPAVRGSPNGNGHPISERPLPIYGQPTGIEWNKHSSAEILRTSFGDTSTKFQGMGLYDFKPGLYHSGTNANLNHKVQTAPQVNDAKLTPKPWTPNKQFLSKMSDKHLSYPSKEKETFKFRRPPSPLNSSSWALPELSPPEPESQQCPPPLTPPPAFMSRQDQKRMTLGHSQLDLVNQYNKMKPKQVYSRFELKSKN